MHLEELEECCHQILLHLFNWNEKRNKILNGMTFKFAPTLHIFQRHIIDNVILTNWNWLPFWLFKNFCNGCISVTNQRLRKCMQSKYPSVSLFTDQLTENLRLLVADSHIAICWFSFFYDQNSYIMWSSIFKTITIVRLQSTDRETLVQIDNYSLKAHWSWNESQVV